MTKILVVDDDPEVRDLLRRTIRRRGWTILTASDGQEALAIAGDENPELIIMDIMMPGPVDGTEATRILKRDPRTMDSIVMILTGKGAQLCDDAEEAGADCFFAKPFSPLELLRKIDEVLGQTVIGTDSHRR